MTEGQHVLPPDPTVVMKVFICDNVKFFPKPFPLYTVRSGAPGPQLFVCCDLVRRSGSHVSHLINVPCRTQYKVSIGSPDVSEEVRRTTESWPRPQRSDLDKAV